MELTDPYQICQIQRALQQLGLHAEEYGLTGVFDTETALALFAFAQACSLDWTEYSLEYSLDVPETVVDAIMAVPLNESVTRSFVDDARAVELRRSDALFCPDPPEEWIRAVNVVSLKRLDEPPTPGKKGPRDVEGNRRKPLDITTIVLHQMGANFGSRPDKFVDVACHYAATISGEVFRVNMPEYYVWHGDDANSFSVGIEVEGHYLGARGQRPYTPPPYDPLRVETVAAARRAVLLAVEEVRAWGGQIRWIQPHRNFSRRKPGCPGEQLWRCVAPWAKKMLGLEVNYGISGEPFGPNTKGGRAIPVEWDEYGTDNYGQ